MDDREPLRHSLKRSHRAVLALLAFCAATSAAAGLLAPSEQEPPPPEPRITTLAIVLALGTIVTRRASTSPVLAARTRVTLYLCSLALAAVLGLLGAFLALERDASETGLVFALAAALFCLRGPERLIQQTRPSPPGTR